MDAILIEHLEMVARELAEEAKEKREWKDFGNSFGREQSKKKLEFWAEVLMPIAGNL